MGVQEIPEDIVHEFTDIAKKLDRFAEAVERQVGGHERSAKEYRLVDDAIQALRMFARVLRGERPIDEDEQKK